tara:strand:+ start:11737 stop:12591 length:855 start_codon:yes stop_codon:yes gene_type:complete
METVALAVSTMGYAIWDNMLAWMVASDPDVSILHLLWLRLLFMSVFLCVFSIKEKTPSRSFLWWLKFSLVAYVIPSIAYTLSVLWEGYRISVSLQSFIPLVVVWRLGISLSEKRCAAIILTMIGTGVIWTSLSWQHGLWVVWSSLLASVLQIFSTAEFFVMISQVKENKVRVMAIGSVIAVCIMFFCMTTIVHPRYLFVSAAKNTKLWSFTLVLCSLPVGIKYWLVAWFSGRLSPDGIAIFECIHPIATLSSDIFWNKDIFEWTDGIAILFFLFGWILYPKSNI